MSFSSTILNSIGLGSTKHCYCAFCKQPRTLNRKKSINFYNIFTCMVASGFIMFALWQDWDPRVVAVFLFLIAVSEFSLQIRWRLSVPCRHCGFDPVLYTKNTEAAAQLVKDHLIKRRQDPNKLLSRALKLPTITPERLQQIENAKKEAAQQNAVKRGRIFSRQI